MSTTPSFLLICLFALIPSISLCQTVDKEGFQVFEYVENDSTYTMKQYFMCFLKSGEHRSQSDEEAAILQTGHMAHMDSLAQINKIHIAGPFNGDDEFRGIVIYNVPTLEEAIHCADTDPMIEAGRLQHEIRPIWLAKGSTLK
jgi:uncharacterized protein YciI